jgi:hypothetical protein
MHRIVFPLEGNLYGRSLSTSAPPHRFLPGAKGGLSLLAWGLGICWIANSAAVVVSDWMPWHVDSYFGVFVLLLIYPFWTIGRKLRQFRTLDELDRPQSLFHDSNDRNEM